VSARSVRALVVGAEERHPLLPNAPTAKEAGVESLAAVTGWSALFGPASLPTPVVEAWVGAIASLGSDRAWLDATRRSGSAPRLLSPGATRDFLRAQIALYRDLARRLGLI
jgi:tripartite-type tricarboxylate transporter receptor subunit TctC